MSYLALARKYRPKRFEDALGQPHVIQALSHALDGDKLHPAILLTGTRGVGKTTLARIIAKGLNCEKGVSSNPCGTCTSCIGVDEGRFVDLLEIDAASNTGVDDVRQLIDNAMYAPARGRYKVYLVDEVHMLSKSAFNALLKTLEEPPPHVKFILATTDPQKLPVTVLSRCLQFNLKRLSSALIRQRLGDVLKQEGLKSDAGALVEISHAADGSMRDGLSLLDQAIAFSGGALTRPAIEEMLGTVGRRTLFEILAAVAAGDAKTLLAGIDKLDAQAPDYHALLNDLATHLQRIAVLQAIPEAKADDDEPAVLELLNKISAEDVQLYYQIVVLGRRDLDWAPSPRIGFEMTLLRLLSFRPDANEPEPAPAPVTASRAAPSAPAPAKAAASERVAAEGPRDSLGLAGFTQQLARHCVPGDEKDGQVRWLLDARYKHLLTEPRRVEIEQALTQQHGKPIRLRIEPGEASGTPAQIEQQQKNDRVAAATAAIESDPLVDSLKKKFGATIRPNSIQTTDAP